MTNEFEAKSKWLNISTAPTNGTTIKVITVTGEEYITHWGKLKSWYVWDWIIEGYENGTWNKVIGWMPCN